MSQYFPIIEPSYYDIETICMRESTYSIDAQIEDVWNRLQEVKA